MYKKKEIEEIEEAFNFLLRSLDFLRFHDYNRILDMLRLLTDESKKINKEIEKTKKEIGL